MMLEEMDKIQFLSGIDTDMDTGKESILGKNRCYCRYWEFKDSRLVLDIEIL
jgi:hypothetical protein